MATPESPSRTALKNLLEELAHEVSDSLIVISDQIFFDKFHLSEGVIKVFVVSYVIFIGYKDVDNVFQRLPSKDKC